MTVEELIRLCLPAKEAMETAFQKVWEDGDYLRAECCGEQVKYKTGFLGPDMAYRDACGAEIRNILSPQVSPILLDDQSHCTAIPSQDLIDRVGGKQWLVMSHLRST